MSREVRLSWGRLPFPPPAEVVDIPETGRLAEQTAGPLLGYGLGRSYGDVCLNPGGTILRTRPLRSVLTFDQDRGRLRAEAGISLAEVLSVIMPAGWFLPVIPGTQFVTLGGAVANDVHGKNHHRDGSFGHFVRSIELERSDGEILELTKENHPELYSATVGGLGLTGLIRSVEIDLLPITSDRVVQRSVRFETVSEFFALNPELAADHRYTVAWIDVTHASGRGIYMAGDHAVAGESPPAAARREPRVAIPFDAPAILINPHTSRAFNRLYWNAHRKQEMDTQIGYRRFFFPLDRLGNWNRLYGKRGFFQYQFVVPHRDAPAVIGTILERLRSHRAVAPLAVLKSLGDKPPVGMLTFPMPGITLAVDIANEGDKTKSLFADFDAIVREARGRLYPAKDARMPAEDFQRAYPRWQEFAESVDPQFSSAFWRRVTDQG